MLTTQSRSNPTHSRLLSSSGDEPSAPSTVLPHKFCIRVPSRFDLCRNVPEAELILELPLTEISSSVSTISHSNLVIKFLSLSSSPNPSNRLLRSLNMSLIYAILSVLEAVVERFIAAACFA